MNLARSNRFSEIQRAGPKVFKVNDTAAEPTAMIKAAEILPVLDDIIGFVGDVFKAHEASQAKVAQLQDQLKQKDKVILEKVAANTLPPRT